MAALLSRRKTNAIFLLSEIGAESLFNPIILYGADGWKWMVMIPLRRILMLVVVVRLRHTEHSRHLSVVYFSTSPQGDQKMSSSGKVLIQELLQGSGSTLVKVKKAGAVLFQGR